MNFQIAPSEYPYWYDFRQTGLGPRELLRGLGIVAPPIDPILVARQLGVQVYAMPPGLDLDQGVDGWVESTATPGPAAYIVVNTSKPMTRQRFTVAHELGHLLKHPLGKHPRDKFSSAGISLQEIEANAFAGELLMPADMVEQVIRQAPHVELHTVFGVSRASMSYRLRNLGYMPR